MSSLNFYIEHTLLKVDSTRDQIFKLCQESIEHDFYGVCIPAYHIKAAKQYFKEHKAKQKIISVVGFPMGYSTVSAKVEEIKKASQDGVDELDVVVNLAAFLSDDMPTLKNDIQSVVMACHLQNKKAKLIIETGVLDHKQIGQLCKIAVDAGADFIKTSTGFTEKGASLEDVKYLRSILPANMKIKASGGIKDANFANELIAAGANRIGTSSGIKLVSQ